MPSLHTAGLMHRNTEVGFNLESLVPLLKAAPSLTTIRCHSVSDKTMIPTTNSKATTTDASQTSSHSDPTLFLTLLPRLGDFHHNAHLKISPPATSSPRRRYYFRRLWCQRHCPPRKRPQLLREEPASRRGRYRDPQRYAGCLRRLRHLHGTGDIFGCHLGHGQVSGMDDDRRQRCCVYRWVYLLSPRPRGVESLVVCADVDRGWGTIDGFFG